MVWIETIVQCPDLLSQGEDRFDDSSTERSAPMKWNIAICIGLATVPVGLDAAAHSGGVSIARELGRRVAGGMTCEDVKTNLGRPAGDFRSGATPGRTWTYNIEGLPPGQHHF